MTPPASNLAFSAMKTLMSDPTAPAKARSKMNGDVVKTASKVGAGVKNNARPKRRPESRNAANAPGVKRDRRSRSPQAAEVTKEEQKRKDERNAAEAESRLLAEFTM